MTRVTKFTISVASEIMAVLSLSKDLEDMKERLAQMVVAFDKSKNPVTVDDLGVTGALAVLLKDTIEPNLMQTLEGTPVLVHTGPFANIAHGCSSIIADNIVLKIVGEKGFVITEAGFGSDIGLEKFFDIKCRTSKKQPNAIVLVVTVRDLKMHGGGPSVIAGVPLKKEYTEENLDLVLKGLPNLIKHIENFKVFGIPTIVAINIHKNDTEAEHDIIIKAALANGAMKSVTCVNWSEGGQGAVKLAEAVIEACESKSNLEFIYGINQTISEKINVIAKKMYGAGYVDLSQKAKDAICFFEQKGYDKLPLCVAKTS